MEMQQRLASGQRSGSSMACINSGVNKGRWPVQEWPIQPLLSENSFCDEKKRNGQNQWISSFSEQMV